MKDVRLRTEKNRLMNRSRWEKQPRHGKVYPQSRTFFSKNGKKSLKKSVPDLRKNPGFFWFVPRNGQFYIIRRTKFPGNRHFLPTGEQKFPRNGQFYDSRRTKIFRESPFFANRRTKIFRKRPVSCQPENEKNEPGDHFPSPSWEISTKIPPPKGRKSEKNSGKTENGATCSQPEQGFFHAAGQMTSRKSHTAGTFLHRTARIFYVSLPGNVRSTRRKPTVPGRKTYGLHTGNIENREKKEIYCPSISEK